MNKSQGWFLSGIRPRVPHISLVFREMWVHETIVGTFEKSGQAPWNPDISRKTSEMWGTQRFVAGQGLREALFSRYLRSGGWNLLQQVDSLLVA